MKTKKYTNDAHECEEKIISILKEYRCYIEYADDLEQVIVVDHDTSEFSDGLDAFASIMRKKR